MEFRQIKYFVKIAQELHFVNAAKKLFVSQSALSQQISLLEDELHVDLFDKQKRQTHRQVVLTEAGEIFYKDAVKILQMVEKLKEKVQKKQHDLTSFTLGTYRLLSTIRTSETIKWLQQTFPNLEINLFEFETHLKVQEAVYNQIIDLGISILPVQYKGLQSITLKKSALSILIPTTHPLNKKNKIDLSKLGKENWIEIRSDIHPLYEHIKQACAIAGIDRSEHIIQEVHSLELLCHMVSSGKGIAFVPSFISTRAYENVVKKEIENHLIEFEQCLVFTQQSLLGKKIKSVAHKSP